MADAHGIVSASPTAAPAVGSSVARVSLVSVRRMGEQQLAGGGRSTSTWIQQHSASKRMGKEARERESDVDEGEEDSRRRGGAGSPEFGEEAPAAGAAA